MKKIIALVMLLLVVFMISGCKQEEMDKKEAEDQKEDTQETVEKVEETPSEDADVLGEELGNDDIEEDIGSADDLEVNPDEFLI